MLNEVIPLAHMHRTGPLPQLHKRNMCQHDAARCVSACKCPCKSVHAFQVKHLHTFHKLCPCIPKESLHTFHMKVCPCIPAESFHIFCLKMSTHSKWKRSGILCERASTHSKWTCVNAFQASSVHAFHVSIHTVHVSVHVLHVGVRAFHVNVSVPSRWNCAHIQSECPCIQSESTHAFHVNVSIKSRWQNVETIQVSIVFMLSTKHSIHALKVKMVMQATCTSVYGFCVKDGPNVKQYRFQFISINLHKTAKYWSIPSE